MFRVIFTISLILICQNLSFAQKFRLNKFYKSSPLREGIVFYKDGKCILKGEWYSFDLLWIKHSDTIFVSSIYDKPKEKTIQNSDTSIFELPKKDNYPYGLREKYIFYNNELIPIRDFEIKILKPTDTILGILVSKIKNEWNKDRYFTFDNLSRNHDLFDLHESNFYSLFGKPKFTKKNKKSIMLIYTLDDSPPKELDLLILYFNKRSKKIENYSYYYTYTRYKYNLAKLGILYPHTFMSP